MKKQILLSVAILVASVSELVLADPAPGQLEIVLDEMTFSSEINMCQAMPGMVILAGESAGGDERIKVLFQDAGGERGLAFELLYTQEGTTVREMWDAEGDAITSSQDGKKVTAEGTLQRSRTLKMVNGAWEESPDSGAAASRNFTLAALCE